jgi:peptidyl-prolyl cis-trans isomerase B (cyclophilin B)
MRIPGARLVLLLGVLSAVAASLAACGDDEPATTSTAATAEGECPTVEAPAPKQVKFDKPEKVLDQGEPATALVETSCGSFVIELDTKRNPQTANSFAFLAEQGFYDDTTFHRIVPDFVIQGGDPKGTGTGGPGYSVREPPPQRTVYSRGLVAMAKNEVEPPGTSGSQFFVVTAPADADLPPDYAVLGEVTHGIDVVARIGELGNPADPEGKATQTVTIDKVTIDTG